MTIETDATIELDPETPSQPRPKRVGMISLGCPKNLVDTEIILGELRAKGFEVVNDVEDADAVVVNTCGFIDEAKEESVDTILEMVGRKGDERGPKEVFVAGCMVNRYGKELQAEIPEIDGFIGLDDLQKAPELITLGSGLAPSQSAAHVVFDHNAPRLLTTQGHAYLKVAEGCNNPCTFCAIPVWRGRFRSRTIDSLVEEAQRLEAQGVQEINLLAQDTTRYGEDLGLGKHGLQKLVEALLTRTNVPWIRFLYAYPTTLHRELLELMGQEERFCSYLDMPLQHSHPDVLRAMRRGGSPTTYRRQLETARELAPDVFLRTTFIVGFPGETEEHFEHLLSFVEEARFDHLGAFLFSVEEDTPSAALPDRPERSVAKERRRRLMDLQSEIGLERRQRLVGQTMRALLLGVCDETEHLLEARHHGLAPEIDGRVLINDGGAPPATMVDVEITEAFPEDLVGRIVGPVDDPRVRVADPD